MHQMKNKTEFVLNLDELTILYKVYSERSGVALLLKSTFGLANDLVSKGLLKQISYGEFIAVESKRHQVYKFIEQSINLIRDRL